MSEGDRLRFVTAMALALTEARGASEQDPYVTLKVLERFVDELASELALTEHALTTPELHILRTGLGR